MPKEESQGRLKDKKPIAVIDIGSNSIRLVIYEGVSRSPTMLFNEKMLAGIGSGLVRTGELDPVGVEKAFNEFRRFRALADQAQAESLHVIATAAAREAKNGPEFIRRAEEILRTPIHVASGSEEAKFAGLGVKSSFRHADGIAGDLGGGSLELIDVGNKHFGEGITLPLGVLKMRDLAGKSMDEAAEIARTELQRADWLLKGRGRPFYCVGGTWRNLAKLHMLTTNYPLQVMHHYRMDPVRDEAFLRDVAKGDMSVFKDAHKISKSRRVLLPYGAAVLLEVIAAMKPSELIISASGVREGFLYSRLPVEDRQKDPLLTAAEELSRLRSRSARHARELADWTGEAFALLGIQESEDEARYRQAACLLADIGWRAHPDYRGTQSLNIIAHGSFIGIDHPGRAYIALTNMFRHEGVFDDLASPEMLELMTPRYLHLARTLGSLMRVVYLLSAAMPGIIPRLKWVKREDGTLVLLVPADKADLMSDRPIKRMENLAKVTKCKLALEVAPA